MKVTTNKQKQTYKLLLFQTPVKNYLRNKWTRIVPTTEQGIYLITFLQLKQLYDSFENKVIYFQISYSYLFASKNVQLRWKLRQALEDSNIGVAVWCIWFLLVSFF